MIESLTLLLVCQLAGEIFARAYSVPLPGPVIGMAILFVGLMIRGGVPKPLQETAKSILDHLSLLFVPAGVGVMIYLPLIADEWLPIATAIIIGTLVTIAVTAWIMKAILSRSDRANEQSADPGE
ncbi:MAG: CidA/LrgA family protein [Gammaproteobacteria bacterium]|nr:CidA/LrgA family protein [Gammaproteobacteria bacterium]MDH3411921.1 CidA/LrgA family protein [Gammaproteobacteria bacterium]